MRTVLIVIHLMVVVALVCLVLLQRSEGGALGIGGGNFMSRRGAANLMTRATTILAAAFFGTSIALTLLARQPGAGGLLLDQLGVGQTKIEGTSPPEPGTATGDGGILDALDQLERAPAVQPTEPGGAPSVPTSE